MKISYNWLKEYINLDIQPEELSVILTDIGLEVEGTEEFESVKGGLKGVVIGEVKTCSKHPNADKLSVTTVDVGNGKILPIVCGAPNVAAGQKVLVAMVGTTLYSGENSFEIKNAKIRGEVSEGMICAEDELGLGNSHDGIIVLPGEVKVGMPAADYFNIENDVVFEIGLTPNRADAASHFGVARDLVAGLNRKFNTNKYGLKLPSLENFKQGNNDLDIEVVVESPEACPRYSGLTISGLKVAESPEWMQNRLKAIGLRPINNIVDITNFVLHEIGQPLHAFDAAKIAGNKVVVKKMKAGTPFITLDEVERKLDEEDLMICNTSEGMCIAGVFGGIESGVTENTKNIFLESAYFDPAHIRKTSKRHTLQTDASFRFERGADPNITVYALKRAALLMQEIAGGKISSSIKDVYPKKIDSWEVEINYKNVDRLIGKVIERENIVKILTDLGIEVISKSESGLKLLIPTFKVDVTREADIIEEILRVYGYNNVELGGKISMSVSSVAKPDPENLQNVIADQLTSQGFSEIMNNSLTKSEYIDKNEDFSKEKNVELLNPLSSDLDVLRQTLLFGGLEVIAYNNNRKASDLKLYEFGKIYQKNENFDKSRGVKNYFEEKHLSFFVTGKTESENWDSSDKNVDFFFLKGTVENVFKKLGICPDELTLKESKTRNSNLAIEYFAGDQVLAVIAVLNKKLCQEFDIKKEVVVANINWDRAISLVPQKEITYKAVSKFPAVRRDLALVLDKEIKFDDLKKAAIKAEKSLLQKVGLFDIYEGDKIPAGKKSYAMSFILQDQEKTMTDKVIESAMKKIQAVLEKEFNAELR